MAPKSKKPPVDANVSLARAQERHRIGIEQGLQAHADAAHAKRMVRPNLSGRKQR